MEHAANIDDNYKNLEKTGSKSILKNIFCKNFKNSTNFKYVFLACLLVSAAAISGVFAYRKNNSFISLIEGNCQMKMSFIIMLLPPLFMELSHLLK